MKPHLSRPLRLSSHTAPTFRPTPVCGTVTSAPLLSSAPMSSSKAMSVTSRAPSHALLRSSDRGTLKITMVTVSPNSNPLAKRPGPSSPPFLKRAGISLTRLIRSHSARRSCHNLSISAPPPYLRLLIAILLRRFPLRSLLAPQRNNLRDLNITMQENLIKVFRRKHPQDQRGFSRSTKQENHRNPQRSFRQTFHQNQSNHN